MLKRIVPLALVAISLTLLGYSAYDRETKSFNTASWFNFGKKAAITEEGAIALQESLKKLVPLAGKFNVDNFVENQAGVYGELAVTADKDFYKVVWSDVAYVYFPFYVNFGSFEYHYKPEEKNTYQYSYVGEKSKEYTVKTIISSDDVIAAKVKFGEMAHKGVWNTDLQLSDHSEALFKDISISLSDDENKNETALIKISNIVGDSLVTEKNGQATQAIKYELKDVSVDVALKTEQLEKVATIASIKGKEEVSFNVGDYKAIDFKKFYNLMKDYTGDEEMAKLFEDPEFTSSLKDLVQFLSSTQKYESRLEVSKLDVDQMVAIENLALESDYNSEDVGSKLGLSIKANAVDYKQEIPFKNLLSKDFDFDVEFQKIPVQEMLTSVKEFLKNYEEESKNAAHKPQLLDKMSQDLANKVEKTFTSSDIEMKINALNSKSPVLEWLTAGNLKLDFDALFNVIGDVKISIGGLDNVNGELKQAGDLALPATMAVGVLKSIGKKEGEHYVYQLDITKEGQMKVNDQDLENILGPMMPK